MARPNAVHSLHYFSSKDICVGDFENNSDVPIIEDSLNGVTEDKYDAIVEDLECISDSDVPIKYEYLNGILKIMEHLPRNSIIRDKDVS